MYLVIAASNAKCSGLQIGRCLGSAESGAESKIAMRILDAITRLDSADESCGWLTDSPAP